MLFKKAVRHDDIELARARERKERGNPPGKRTDPLGDQLTWEQLLTAMKKGKTKLWLVSNDGDYFISHDNKFNLNPFLRNELGTAEVFPHKSIVDWSKTFQKESGIAISKGLTKQEADEIERESKDLPQAAALSFLDEFRRYVTSGALASGVLSRELQQLWFPAVSGQLLYPPLDPIQPISGQIGQFHYPPKPESNPIDPPLSSR